jgi:predicted MFS family arabinose efflux permease
MTRPTIFSDVHQQRELMNNKKRITLLSFLAYFVMSGMLAPIGIISSPMAEYYDVPITELTANFSWLTFGILAGAVIALVIFDWIPLKKLMVLLYGLILACLLSLTMHDEFDLIWLSIGLVGICCGVGLAGAALIISKTYNADQRASMLVITDGSFSVAGIICSWIAVVLVAREFHWSGPYVFVALIAAAVVLLSLFSRFPESEVEVMTVAERDPWPASVWLCLIALFLYTLGQYSMLLWLPNYAETQLGAPRDQAGQLVSQFWTGMFAAQLFVAWWVLRVGVRRLVLIAGVLASLASMPLWFYDDIDSLIVLTTIWGFANLGLLKIVLSFATEMVRIPTARLISTLLLGASLGTAVSPWLTSKIVAATDNHFILQFSTGCYIVLTILLVLATRLHDSENVDPTS